MKIIWKRRRRRRRRRRWTTMFRKPMNGWMNGPGCARCVNFDMSRKMHCHCVIFRGFFLLTLPLSSSGSECMRVVRSWCAFYVGVFISLAAVVHWTALFLSQIVWIESVRDNGRKGKWQRLPFGNVDDTHTFELWEKINRRQWNP